MNTKKPKTLDAVIEDLQAQCDTKASAVAELLDDMRYNMEAGDITPLDCANEVREMGEWGKYAARELMGTVEREPKKKKAKKKQLENTCPKCGADLCLAMGEEETNGEGEAIADWTCPKCAATGRQVRVLVFACHIDVKKFDKWAGCVCHVETCGNWEGNMGGDDCEDCSNSFANRAAKRKEKREARAKAKKAGIEYCPICSGTGELHGNKCYNCGGVGHID